jgi:imidazoleglycerol-phosphate dehydratase
MLTLLAKHALIDLQVHAEGDLQVDPHHTVEDVGICLGKAVAEALGDLAGVRRYGHAVIPMDEALAEAAIDLSGRPLLVYRARLRTPHVGQFDAELAEEFFRAFATHARATLHVHLRTGRNTHHCIEGMFKAVARALREAVSQDPREKGIPSTKGMLQT